MAYVLIGASTCAFSDKGYYPYKRRRFLPAMYVHSLCNIGFSLQITFLLRLNLTNFTMIQVYIAMLILLYNHHTMYYIPYFYDLSTFAIQQ